MPPFLCQCKWPLCRSCRDAQCVVACRWALHRQSQTDRTRWQCWQYWQCWQEHSPCFRSCSSSSSSGAMHQAPFASNLASSEVERWISAVLSALAKSIVPCSPTVPFHLHRRCIARVEPPLSFSFSLTHTRTHAHCRHHRHQQWSYYYPNYCHPIFKSLSFFRKIRDHPLLSPLVNSSMHTSP